MYDVVISGYYGFKNSGDEALLGSIIKDLRTVNPNIKIMVLSNEPEFTMHEYAVDSVKRTDFFGILKILKSTKLLISGGGSLIQDATSSKSLFYYLGIIRLAKICGAKVMVYANGVGPVRKSFNRFLSKRVLNKTELITLREPDSKEEIASMGVIKPQIEVTADPALGIAVYQGGAEICKEIFTDKTPIAFSVREWCDLGESEIKALEECILHLKEKNFAPFMLPMQYSKDEAICRKIADDTGVLVLRDEYSVDKLIGILSCCPIVVGMRLHALIYAIAGGSTPIGLVYDPKVCGFMKYMGLDSYLDVKDLTSDKLIDMVENLLINKPSVDLENMKILAFKNAQKAIELLK